MSADAPVSRFDGLKWLVVVALVAAAVVGNSYFANESLLYRVLAIVAVAVVAGFVDPSSRVLTSFVLLLLLLLEALLKNRTCIWHRPKPLSLLTLFMVAVAGSSAEGATAELVTV